MKLVDRQVQPCSYKINKYWDVMFSVKTTQTQHCFVVYLKVTKRVNLKSSYPKEKAFSVIMR